MCSYSSWALLSHSAYRSLHHRAVLLQKAFILYSLYTSMAQLGEPSRTLPRPSYVQRLRTVFWESNVITVIVRSKD